ncbi:hypothetical protein K7G98_04045 [Saccharothrix sp. MB29]|nr:hypothetical protein [Saccharothrix sp. MB29]
MLVGPGEAVRRDHPLTGLPRDVRGQAVGAARARVAADEHDRPTGEGRVVADQLDQLGSRVVRVADADAVAVGVDVEDDVVAVGRDAARQVAEPVLGVQGDARVGDLAAADRLVDAGRPRPADRPLCATA